MSNFEGRVAKLELLYGPRRADSRKLFDRIEAATRHARDELEADEIIKRMIEGMSWPELEAIAASGPTD